jgi:hypothetical protein
VILDGVDDGTDDCADGECELNEGCLKGVEAVAKGQLVT